MPMAILNNPFMQVALPIMFAVLVAAWLNGKSMEAISKRIDDLRSDMNGRNADVRNLINGRFDDIRNLVNGRFDDINHRLGAIEGRLSRLESSASPLLKR